jgi:hypothetical protein
MSLVKQTVPYSTKLDASVAACIAGNVKLEGELSLGAELAGIESLQDAPGATAVGRDGNIGYK